MAGIRAFLLCVLTVAAVVVAACGGEGDDETTGSATPAETTETLTTETTAGGPCGAIEEVEIGPVEHSDKAFTVADYDTNPPAGGDHNDPALEGGTFYT